MQAKSEPECNKLTGNPNRSNPFHQTVREGKANCHYKSNLGENF